MKELLHKRNHSLDVIRIAAVLAVVMIHCCAPFVTNYEPHMAEFVFGNVFDSMARMGVPLFLMLSGALFLDERREITLKGIVTKNVKNLAILTILWAAAYSLVYNVLVLSMKGSSVHTEVVIDGILNGHGHMWYLYMTMGIYVITPFLRKIVRRENRELVLSFILISFAVQFLLPTVGQLCPENPGIAFLLTWIDKFHLDFFDGYITYYLLGWYIVHVGITEKHQKTIVYFTGLAALAFIICYAQFTGDHEAVYEYIGAPVFLYSVSIFLLLNDIKFNFNERAANITAELSKLSFGVYIIHVLVLDTFNKILPYSGHCAFSLPVRFVTVSGCSFLCIYVMSKIPFIKKLIKM